jgi:hypothetical protein
MHNVIVIDDVVDKEIQDLIEKSIFNPDTQWTLGRTVFYEKHPEVVDVQRNGLMSFTKSLARIDDKFFDKDIQLYTSPLHNLNIQSLLTSRIQLQLPVITDKLYGVPHVDGYRDFPYKVAVYYVNDVDGDTFLFKQTTKDTTPEQIKEGNLDIDQRISPKKGRLIIFDGNIYHAVGKPKTDLRCIINYNFI